MLKKIILLLIFAFIMANVSLGFAADKQKDADAKQIAACTKAITANPNDVAAYVKRGKAYTNNNQLALAMADYTQAIKLDPKKYAGLCSTGAELFNKPSSMKRR